MLRWIWVVLILIALALTAAIFINRARQPMAALADQCVRIYADELPKGVRLRHVRQEGTSLIVYVHHLNWAGEIRCALYRNGSLDEVESLNRKTEVLWSEPPMPLTP
jgi:hypothetical protein